MDQWIFSEEVLIPKEEGSMSLDQFRFILLLNTENKIIFGLLSRRFSNLILRNDYIVSSVQKGGVAGMRCFSQLLRVTREKQR